MNDELTQLLLQRAVPQGVPSVPNKVPPEWKRYAIAEEMKQAVRNGWEPNPTLIRILRGN